MKQIIVDSAIGEDYDVVLHKVANGIILNFKTTVPTKALLEAIIDVVLNGVDVVTDDTIEGMNAWEVTQSARGVGYHFYMPNVNDFTGAETYEISKRPDRLTGKETAE